MTGQQFINSVMIDTDRYVNLTTDTDYRAMCLDWLNRVLKNIASMQDGFHWRWLEKTATFPTVAAQMSYDLPSDIDSQKIVSVTQSETDFKLNFIAQEDLDSWLPDPTGTNGNPRMYTLYANSIRLIPIPNSVITITERYIKNITTLTDAAVSGDTPTKWDDIIIQGILAKAYRFDKRKDDAADANNQFLLGIERMKTDNSQIIDDAPVAKDHRVNREYLRTRRPAG